jgi:hypothetical protein
LPSFGGILGENYPKPNAAARKALELDATLGANGMRSILV